MSESLEKDVQLHERDAQGRDWLVYPIPRGGVVSYPLPVEKGGTGATDSATARASLGVTLSNLGAAASNHTHTPASIGAATASHTHTPESIGAATSGHSHTLSDLSGPLSVAKGGTGSTSASAALTNLGAAATSHTHTPASIGAAASSHSHVLNDLTGPLAVAN